MLLQLTTSSGEATLTCGLMVRATHLSCKLLALSGSPVVPAVPGRETTAVAVPGSAETSGCPPVGPSPAPVRLDYQGGSGKQGVVDHKGESVELYGTGNPAHFAQP